MPIKLQPFASISTVHVTERDGRKILDGACPFLIATYDQGGFFYIPLDDSEEQIRETCSRWSMSDSFLLLILTLRSKECPYLHLTSDEPPIAEFATHDW